MAKGPVVATLAELEEGEAHGGGRRAGAARGAAPPPAAGRLVRPRLLCALQVSRVALGLKRGIDIFLVLLNRLLWMKQLCQDPLWPEASYARKFRLVHSMLVSC